jgi:prolyl oligopeptidase
MLRRLALLVLASPCLAAAPVPPGIARAPAYPPSPRGDLVESRFGHAVTDPWRWLEAGPRSDPAVTGWIARQNAVTQAYLAQLPARAWFASRLRQLDDYDRLTLPRKGGNRYFYMRTHGADEPWQLWMRGGFSGSPRMLLPAAAEPGGRPTLDPWLWEPSGHGSYLAYSLRRDGSDWRELHVVDVRTGQPLPESLRNVADTRIAWIGDSGFLYSRYSDGASSSQGPRYGKSVWFHRPATPFEADELVYATPDHPEWGHTAQVTSDGRYVVITTAIGTAARLQIHVIDLRGGHGWRAAPLVEGFAHDWRLVDSVGRRLWFITDQGAPNNRLVSVDLGHGSPRWHDVVPERSAPLQQASIIGDRLVLTYAEDGGVQALLVQLDGGRVEQLALNAVGTAAGFRGRPGDPETFFSLSSFARPPSIYRFNVATGTLLPFAEPHPEFAAGDYRIDQVTARSPDGTRVPISLIRRRDIAEANRPVPTLLYGYGGFGIAVNPGFSTSRMAWLQAGGAFALATLRGGGEFGAAWHAAGAGAAKQNAFDDFIAAAQWLIDNHVTPPDGLAVQGASNGGLLVGAVVNQRPDLFAAANPRAGVMDMLRFDRFTAGRYWTDDYGDPAIEADWNVLRAYSPYHNIRPGRDYPAILVTTGDSDDRVVPAHSFKYTAALQSAAIGPKPHLLRVAANAGHTAAGLSGGAIAEDADILAFLAAWTGLDPQATPPLAPAPATLAARNR